MIEKKKLRREERVPLRDTAKEIENMHRGSL